MKTPTSEGSEHSNISPDVLDAFGTVLLDDWAAESPYGSSYLLRCPIDVIVCDSHAQLPSCLQAIADYQAQGKYATGYVAYDAGVGLDKPLQSRHNAQVPLLWMGIYDDCTQLDRADAHFGEWDSRDSISSAQLNVSNTEYISRVRRIKQYIEAGDVYQVNYTCKLRFRNNGTAAGLFARLREAHPVCHSAFINAGDFQVISLSPELFLRLSGSQLTTKPMKGTSHRGRSAEQDTQLATALQHDEKNRAENLMIVDLMRNDIGRVCEYGSVDVRDMFRVEHYRTVLQMTSEVQGRARQGLACAEFIKATFPPGSVTGAPKARAVEIIDELEHESRGVYCGCIGLFRPDGGFLLNVAIRTIVQREDTCEMGVGGGIVADSDPELELQEVLLKGKFLTAEPVKFELLETLLYETEQGYAYLDHHVARMLSSARYFGYSLSEEQTREALANTAADIRSSCPGGDGRFRVRLLSTECGSPRAEWQEIERAADKPTHLILAEHRTDPEDVFLYHKTTNRQGYDRDLTDARRAGYSDVLYLNTRGELTECAITNVFIKRSGQWYTPPVECGLLPGIWRTEMLKRGAVEKVLTLRDLADAEAVIVGNSVRGATSVTSICGPDGATLFSAQLRS